MSSSVSLETIFVWRLYGGGKLTVAYARQSCSFLLRVWHGPYNHRTVHSFIHLSLFAQKFQYNTTTRKPSYRWQTRATRKPAKLLQFDVPTTFSLTILAYLHAFNCYCVRNPRNPEKFIENSNLWSSRSSKVIDIGVNRKPICDLLLVINSNFSRICYRFRDIHG